MNNKHGKCMSKEELEQIEMIRKQWEEEKKYEEKNISRSNLQRWLCISFIRASQIYEALEKFDLLEKHENNLMYFKSFNKEDK